jgi:hypothetical protein
VDAFERLAAVDRFREHELLSEANDADIILFLQCHMVDWRLRAIREHPVARQHWDRVMVFDERDRPWRSFPGAYVNTPAGEFVTESQRAWGYLGAPNVPSSHLEPDLLFSFVGSNTARCRKPLFDLWHPDTIVEETRDFLFWNPEGEGYASKWRNYKETLARSRFVLCPRGRGTSSFRLYETLAAGRVPVIISDDWVAPSGPAWETFSLRWPESKVKGLVELLQERDDEWGRMSIAARNAFDTFFAPNVTFHRIVELCRELRECGAESPTPWRMGTRSLVAAARERVKSQ